MTNSSESQKSNGNRKSAVEAALQVDKLRLEVERLKRDATLSGRLAAIIVPMSVSAITALAAIVGIAVSIDALIKQGTDRSHDVHDRSLQQALAMATDNKAGSDRRISGICQLRPFWAIKSDEQVLAATLAALVILRGTGQEAAGRQVDPPSGSNDSMSEAASVRCAATEAIGAAYSPTLLQLTRNASAVSVSCSMEAPTAP
jgi:hypothetical protein